MRCLVCSDCSGLKGQDILAQPNGLGLGVPQFLFALKGQGEKLWCLYCSFRAFATVRYR